MSRTAPPLPRRVPRRQWWRAKLTQASTPLERWAVACDWFRAEMARHPDQKAARKLLEQETDDLIEQNEKLARNPGRRTR